MRKAVAKVGRPSKYSEEIAARICDGLIEGKSLRQLCQVDDMPDRSTVLRWIDADQDFAARCARARMLQADLMDDLIIETAETCTNENAQAARVKIAAYQWRAAKLAPKKYGEKVTLAGDEENPIAHRVIERRVVDPAG